MPRSVFLARKRVVLALLANACWYRETPMVAAQASSPDACPSGEHDVRSWSRVDPAKFTPARLVALRHSECEWSVALRDGVPTASETRAKAVSRPVGFQPPRPDWALSVLEQGRAGFLVGYDEGEFGGRLLWCEPSGAVVRELLNDNVRFILPDGARFVVLTGLAHLTTDKGRVVEILDTDRGFEVTRQTELGGSPDAAALDTNGGALIATGSRLLRLTPEFHVHRLLEHTCLWIAATSLVITPRGMAYIAARGGVLELDVTKEPPQETWLLPM